MTVALVALGGAIGAVVRHLVQQSGRTRSRYGSVAGTLLVNVAGSLVLGVLTGALVAPRWQALIGVGLCGAMTTYSGFAMETVVLAEGRERLLALTYVLLSVVAGLAAALFGLAAGVALAG